MQEVHDRVEYHFEGAITLDGTGYILRHVVSGFKASSSIFTPHEHRLQLLNNSSREVLDIYDDASIYALIPEPAKASPLEIGIEIDEAKIAEVISTRTINEPSENLSTIMAVDAADIDDESIYVVDTIYTFDAASDYAGAYIGANDDHLFFRLTEGSFAASVTKLVERNIRDTLTSAITDNTTSVDVDDDELNHTYEVGNTYVFVKSGGGTFTADFVETTGGVHNFNNISGTVDTDVARIEEHIDRDTLAEDVVQNFGGASSDLDSQDYYDEEETVQYTFNKTSSGTYVGTFVGIFEGYVVFELVSGTIDLDVSSIERAGTFEIPGVTSITAKLIDRDGVTNLS